MIGKQMWERYLLKEILKVFFFFLFSFFFLYALLDYSMHLQEILKSQKIPKLQLGIYYGMLLSKRSDLLLPLSLLIATLKVLTSLNRRYELLAFQAAGISIKRLMRPFFLVGIFCVAINYLNFEYITPRSVPFTEKFEKHYFRSKKALKKKKETVHVLPLEDNSRLIYLSFDEEKKELQDVYWVLSTDQFFHMKSLSLNQKIPEGNHVDTFIRKEKSVLEKGDSYENYLFQNLKLDFDLKNYILNPMPSRSILDLFKLMSSEKKFWNEKKELIQAHLFYKLLSPLLSLLVLIGITPFASHFSRNFPVFLLFACGIFGYLAFFMVIDASLLLAESQVVSPILALFLLPFLYTLFFGRKFIRMG